MTTDGVAVEVEKEVTEKRAFLVAAAEVLTSALDAESVSESQGLREAVDLVLEWYGELAVKDRFYQQGNSASWDTAFVSLALAYKYRSVESEKANEYKELFLHLFPNHWDVGVQISKPESKKTTFTLVQELVKRCFPNELQSDANQVKVVAFIRSKADRGVLRLPYLFDAPADKPELSAKRLMDEIYDQQGVPAKQRTYPVGSASRYNQYAVIWQDSSFHVENHERNHLVNDGLLVGVLGSFLDEGMTELLAQEQAAREGNMIPDRDLSYNNEVDVLKQLREFFSDL